MSTDRRSFRHASSAVRPWRGVLLAVAILAAGCAAPGETSAGTDPLVTSDTGVIRGLVVDASVTPVAGALVQVLGGGNTTAADDGTFAFAQVPPGTYPLLVSHPGFQAERVTVTVEAGVADVDVVKVVLQRDLEATPYVVAESYEGFMDQGFTVAGVRGSSADSPDLSYDRLPDFLQVEMVWDSTQALGEGMEITLIAFEEGSTTGDSFATVTGTSPLHVNVVRDDLVDAGIGGTTRVSVAVFSSPDPDAPAPVSFTIDQPFTMYIHSFYGYAPPEGWTFVADGEAPPP